MISPRWRKVLRDVWGSKTRTLLVVLSIAVGVAAVGMIMTGDIVLRHELTTAYSKVSPASATLYTSGFDEDFLNIVRHLPEIKAADARSSPILRMRVGSSAEDEWRNIQLIALPDFKNIPVNKITLVSGAWPPPDHGVLIERSSLSLTQVNVGDTIMVQGPSGKIQSLKIAGIVQDLNQPSASFTKLAVGYINLDTLTWLSYGRFFSQMNIIVAGDAMNKEHIQQVAKLVTNKVEKAGGEVGFTYIPEPGQHWFLPYLTPMTALLGFLGSVALALSAFLVVNTVSALLTQQVRQIGVMKAIGARSGQIISMYIATLLIYGLLALLLAVPLGFFGAKMNTAGLISFINFQIDDFQLPRQVLVIQVILALLVPILAGLIPIIAGTRLTVREAISSYGLGKGNYGESRIDRILGRIGGLSRPMLLSLRNTFRRRARLVLTLATLTLASALFIAVASLYNTLIITLDEALRYFNYEVEVDFARSYRTELIQRQVTQIPGMQAAEMWGFSGTRIVRSDGSTGGNLLMIAPPIGTKMIRPILLEGRWLLPEDDNGLVINTDVLRDTPGIKVGDEVVLKLEDRDTRWRVVGVVRTMLTNPPFVYTNYPYYALLTGNVGRAGAIYVQIDQKDPASQKRIAKEIEKHFEKVGMKVNSTSTTADIRQTIMMQFDMLIVLIMVMCILLAVVGGLGLMATMSLNVLERTREIGVMRAIGASDGAITRLVISEGILIGLMSFAIGAALAFPLGKLLSDMIGAQFLHSPLSYTYSIVGLLIWFGLVTLIAVLASLLPARNATRLSVRETLAYE